jgi:ribosomal protein S18 acetylase RimI-like enzyme
LIINVYVEPDWRQQGIAERLMRHMIDFARKSGIPSLVLHASEAGRPLYERLGFTPTGEMRLFT